MEVSSVHKQNNWMLYEHAMSPDPALASQYVGKLLGSLESAARIAGITEYDPLFNMYREPAKDAWRQYAQGQPGKSMETVHYILGGITAIVYDQRISAAKASGFSGARQTGGFENGLRV